MARGHPDWYVNDDPLKFYGSDVNELAARLGGFPKVDRIGRVIWYDDFSNGIGQYEQDHTGANSRAYVDYDNKRSGDGSLALQVDAADNSVAKLNITLPVVEFVKHSLSFWYAVSTTNASMSTYLSFWDGATLKYAIVTVGHHNHTLRIKTLGEFSIFLSSNVYDYGELPRWNYIKLVIDSDAGFYDRLVFGDVEYDIGVYDLYSEAALNTPKNIQLTFECEEIGLTQSTFYIDNVVYMVDEV